MARPKDGSVSVAFQEKATAEQDKLEQRLARLLQADMARLLEDESHADVSLLVAGNTLHIHTAIIKQRAPYFYNKYLKDASGTSVTMETADVSLLQEFIRSVYTSDVIPTSQWNMTDTEDVNMAPEDTTEVAVDSNGNGQQSDQLDKEATRSPDGLSNGHQWSMQSGCCQLATDLLTMYREGTNSDVVVVAQGRRFKAHRCVLSARSSYFAAMLSGAWVESSTQEINLEGVSTGVVEQALLFMYGGRAELTPTCDLGELVMVSDMYGIAGIKDIATFILKRDYCHFFHKPCNGCQAGVCETLPLTISFRLTDLQERCLRWCSKNFVRIWPTKPFALLPQEVLDKCCDHLISEIGTQTVLDVIVDADRLTGVMPQVRWADPVVSLTTRLMDTCVKYLGSNLVGIVASKRFLSLNTTMAMGIDFLQDVMKRSVAVMPVQKACTTYLQCRKLAEEADRSQSSEDPSYWSEDFCNLLRAIYKYCEQYMYQYVHLVMGTEDWKLLSPTDQARIKEGGSFVIPVDSKHNKQPPKPHTKATGASRPTMLPSRRRVRSRPGSSSKTPPSGTPSPAAGSASSGGRTPQTPQNKKGPGASSPRAPGQTRLTPTATTPGTSTKAKTVSLTLKESDTKEVHQNGDADASMEGAGAVGGAAVLKSPDSAEVEKQPSIANGESASLDNEGASAKDNCKEQNNEVKDSGKNPPNDSDTNFGAGAAVSMEAADKEPGARGHSGGETAGAGADTSKEDIKKKNVEKQPIVGGPGAKGTKEEGHGSGNAQAAGSRAAGAKATGSRAAEAKATSSRAAEAKATGSRAAEAKATGSRAAEAKAIGSSAAEAKSTGSRAAEAKATGSRAAEAKATGSRAAASRASTADKKDSNLRNKQNSKGLASGLKDPSKQPRKLPMAAAAAAATSSKVQTKDAKTAANLRKTQTGTASNIAVSQPNKRNNPGKNDDGALKSRPSLPLFQKTRPKSVPSSSSKDSDRSRTSSASSPASSPRSTGSASKLPVASKYPKPRMPQMSNKQNDAIYAKCTSMRIAAMKKRKPFDADLDFETESVISTISHVAVKGSRTPSLADLDLSPNEFEGQCNGTCNEATTIEEVQFCPPEDHNDVIIPVLDAVFTAPDATKDR